MASAQARPNTTRRKPKQAWAGAVQDQKELHDTKRAAIVRMAARMFAEEGYAGTSLVAIARRLNVTKPTLYYYIKNKEDILDACVDAGLDAVRSNLARAHAEGADGFEKLIIFFRLHVGFLQGDYGALLVAANQDLTRAHKRKLKSVDRAVIGLLEEGIEDGSIRPCDTKMTCFALFGAFNAIPQWYREGGDKSYAEIVSEYFAILFEGLGTGLPSHGTD